MINLFINLNIYALNHEIYRDACNIGTLITMVTISDKEIWNLLLMFLSPFDVIIPLQGCLSQFISSVNCEIQTSEW